VRRPAEWQDDLAQVLQDAQYLLLKHPVATQAAVRALVAEGRRFAETPDGRRWKTRLAGSELVRRARMLWQGSVLNMFEESPGTLLPSALLDAVMGALVSDELPALLARLLAQDYDDAGPVDS
jgi:hypothetical protein